MIPVINLIQGIDDKLNKLSTLNGQFIPVENKILVLNKSQIKLILKKIDINNNYQLGLDSFKKRYEDLEQFIIPYEQLSLTKTPNDVFNSYNVSTNTTTQSYFLPIDMYILATKGNCKNRVLEVIEIVKHGDLQIKLKSPHSTPNFSYQESIVLISGNNIYVYPDRENTFTINSLYLSYLRYPAYIDIAGYTHLDSTPSITTDCELDSYLENELLDIAVEELAMNTGNQELTQNTLRKNQENE